MASNSSQPTNTADYTIDDIEDQENSWIARCGHRHQNARDRGNDNCWECDMNEIAEETTETDEGRQRPRPLEDCWKCEIIREAGKTDPRWEESGVEILYCDDCEAVSTGRFRCYPDGRITREESSEDEEFLSESSEDEEIGLEPHSPPHTERAPTPPPFYEEIQSQTREEVQRLLAESSEEEDESSEDEEIGLEPYCYENGDECVCSVGGCVPPPPHSPPHTRREPTPPPLYEEIDTTPPPPMEEPKVQSFVCATFEPTRFIYNTNGLDLSKYEYYVKWGTLYVEVAPDDIREFSEYREEEDDMKFPTKIAHFNEDEIDEGEHWE